MPHNWSHLKQETVAAQLKFLEAEVETGLNFAQLALNSSDGGKISRNTVNARTACETIVRHLADFPPDTPGLQCIREKLAELQHLVGLLDEQH